MGDPLSEQSTTFSQELESPKSDACDHEDRSKFGLRGDVNGHEGGLPMLLGSNGTRSSSLEKSEQQSDQDQHEKDGQGEQRSCQKLFAIAFIGSIDDLSLFVPMLVGKGFGGTQLILGALIASIMLVLMCLAIGLCKRVADCLAKIPLACIVYAFAASLLVKGILMDGKS